MKRAKTTRRKKRMLHYGALSVAGLFIGAILILVARPTTEPYVPGGKVEGITNVLDRSTLTLDTGVRLVDVTEQAGIDFVHFYGDRSTQLPEDMGSGLAWGDYNNDGFIDLYICNMAGPLTMTEEEMQASPALSRLYRNNGDGTFTDVTEETGAGVQGWAMAAAWADYTGNGYPDLVVTRYGTNVLLRNDGGVFADVSEESGIGNLQGFWAGASWADYDGDGYLDLYICGYVQYRYSPLDAGKASLQYQASLPFTLNPSSYAPERNLLYRNNRDGTFTEVAEQAGVDNPTGRSLVAAWCDFDDDGWPDLYVANDISDNAMYRNMGDGTFQDVSHSAWVADYRGAMGLAIGDWDGDTDQDIFVSHWIAQENAFYTNLMYVFGDTTRKGTIIRFMDIADQIGLGQIGLDYIGWGTFFFDFDNDGLPDLFLANGSTFQQAADPRLLVGMEDQLFLNRGEEDGFYEIGKISGDFFSRLLVGRGAAFADYDNDGDLDIIVLNHGGRVTLLRNEGGNDQNWLQVRLRGGRGNTAGIGARIEIAVRGQKQVQIVGAQPSYLSQNMTDAHFGLGRETTIDQVRVTFPGGKESRLENIPANQLVTLTED
jgi:enediyne biosynthesis protein E4